MTDDERERVTQDRRDAIALGTQNARWVFSSLLLVHGAALVALLNSADKLPPGALMGARDFAGGLIAALAGGALLAFTAFGAAARFDGDLRDKQGAANIGCAVQLSNAVSAFVFLLTSLGLFVTGVMQVGTAMGIGTPR